MESANTDIPGEMERLAYDVNNIELLCIGCHIRAHKELRSHEGDTIQERKQLKRRSFMQRNDPNYQPDSSDKD